MVVGFDQPLYAIAKRLQWYHYGYQKLVIMLGALHIETAILRRLSDWLQCLTSLSSAGVTSPGNESLLTGHNIAPSKYVHQVTAKVVRQLMQRTFKSLNEGYSEDEREQRFQEWCDKMKERSPQFQFWHIALSMEMDYLLFLRSIRSRNFDLYVHSLDKRGFWLSTTTTMHDGCQLINLVWKWSTKQIFWYIKNFMQMVILLLQEQITTFHPWP